MRVVSFATRRPVTVFIFALAAVVFGLQFPGQVYLGAGYVAVDIHAAGHDHHTAHVNFSGTGGGRFHHESLLHVEVSYFPVNAVGGVMHRAPGELNALRHKR